MVFGVAHVDQSFRGGAGENGGRVCPTLKVETSTEMGRRNEKTWRKRMKISKWDEKNILNIMLIYIYNYIYICLDAQNTLLLVLFWWHFV